MLPPRDCITLETTNASHRFTVVGVHDLPKTKLGFILLGDFSYFLLFLIARYLSAARIGPRDEPVTIDVITRFQLLLIYWSRVVYTKSAINIIMTGIANLLRKP